MAMTFEPQPDVVKPRADETRPQPEWFLAETSGGRRKWIEGPVYVPDPRKKVRNETA